MGTELLFLDATSNTGDYKADTTQYPHGLGPIRDQLHAEGLQIGLHLISGGAQVCLDQMEGGHDWLPGGCRGNIGIDTAVSREHPEMMIPQGPAPRDWFWVSCVSAWFCLVLLGFLILLLPCSYRFLPESHLAGQ